MCCGLKATSPGESEICIICGAKCCKSTQPTLTSDDISRIKDIVKGTPRENFVKEKIRDGKRYFLVRKKDSGNDCIFLEDSKCVIDSVKPLDCRMFPVLFKIEDGRLVSLYHKCLLSEKIDIRELERRYIGMIKELIEKNRKCFDEYQAGLELSGAYKGKRTI